MNHCRCYCQHDYDSMALWVSALNDVLTDRYLIFRKPAVRYWFFNTFDKKMVRVPKYYEENYRENRISFLKECITLIDQGYKNQEFTDDRIEQSREIIREYQLERNEVWE